MTTAFEVEVGRLMTRFNSPGLSVDMLAGGRHHSAYMGRLIEGLPHKVTRDARYASVCLIKLLIAIEILMLAEKGSVTLDAPIADYLPELAEGPTAKGKIIKLRHLLSHTGGYRSAPVKTIMPLAHESWKNCVQFLHDTEQLFAPGTVFDDDHLSYIILGQVIERIKEQHVITVVAEDILKPLRITPHTRPGDVENPKVYTGRHSWNREEKKWEPQDDTYEGPDAASSAMSYLSMSSGDMLRIGEALMDNYAGPGAAIITPFIREHLFTERIQLPEEFSPFRFSRWSVRAFGMGVAFFRDGHHGCFTVGRGQNCSLVYDRTRKSLVSLAMNTPNAPERDALLNTLFAKFAGDTSIRPEQTKLDMDFASFMGSMTTRDIGGVYMGFMPEPIEIFADPRGFTLRMEKQDRYRIEASAENRLVMHARLPVSLGLFRDPASQRPCLMMGMHAFRKVD